MRSLLMEINASDDIRGIYSVLSKELAHLMPFTELSIVLSDWASAGLLVIRGTKEADAEVVSLPTTDDDVLAGLFNGLEPVILERGPQLAKLLKTSCFALKNHASLFFVPLSVGKSKAAILIASHERHGFHTDHINTVRQLQPPLAVSLERVSTLGALKHLQQQWEATFHAIHHPLFILDEDLSLARTNAAADQLLHDLPDVDPLIRSFSTVGDVLKIRGREFQVLRTHFQHRNRQLILLQLREVTEEKDLHQRLLHSEKLATIGVLSEKVAHELNNPLAGIMALSQLLQPEFDEPIKGDLVEVERACRRCKHTIENLVQFSRASPGKSMESISLNSVIEETLMLARAGLKGIDIHLALDPHLPRVKGRFQELQQVIFNLIQNAAHAMQGQGNLFIETGIDPVTHRVHCKVRDTGDGIPAHIRPHIFQPFFTTKRVGVGTGLGLSICRKIMTEHGGDIKLLFSEEHQGTAFELMLRSEA
jgi:signal transduction histidine kinase